MTTQQLIYRAERWPWKWFKVFREAAHIAEQECVKSNVLQCEHNSLKLDHARLQHFRLDDAEKAESLRNDINTLRHELAIFQKRVMEYAEREKLQSLEINKLLEERQSLITKHDQVQKGNAILFEFIRRNKATDDDGNPIPNLRLSPTAFRQ